MGVANKTIKRLNHSKGLFELVEKIEKYTGDNTHKTR